MSVTKPIVVVEKLPANWRELYAAETEKERNPPAVDPADGVGGSVMTVFGAKQPTGNMSITNSSTSKTFWLNAVAPTYVDGASTLSVPVAANQEGYMNV